MDTLGTKRKIFIYPMRTRDILGDYLKKINGKAKPQANVIVLNDPPNLGNDSSYQWDQSKLKGVEIISGKDLHSLQRYFPKDGGSLYYDSLYNTKWHQKFGYGYVRISYPMYNPYIKKMFIYEWLDNNSFCGTGRDRKFFYQKVNNKWVTY